MVVDAGGAGVDAALEGGDDVGGDEADADAVGVEGGEDGGAEGGLELLELGLAEAALEGGGEEDEVGALGVGDGLEVAEVDGGGEPAGEDGDGGGGPGIMVPPAAGGSAAAEVVEVLPAGGEVGGFSGKVGSRLVEEEEGEGGFGSSEEIHGGNLGIRVLVILIEKISILREVEENSQ